VKVKDEEKWKPEKNQKKLPMLTNVICFWFVLLVFLIFFFSFFEFDLWLVWYCWCTWMS